MTAIATDVEIVTAIATIGVIGTIGKIATRNLENSEMAMTVGMVAGMDVAVKGTAAILGGKTTTTTDEAIAVIADVFAA